MFHVAMQINNKFKNKFQFVIRFIGPQIGNTFSQHQQTNSPPR